MIKASGIAANKKISGSKRKRKTASSRVIVNLQQVTKAKQLPDLAEFKTWVAATLEYAPTITIKCGNKKKFSRHDKLEITIRLVGAKESAALNSRYRHKKNPTNVLSFPTMALTSGGCSEYIVEKLAEEPAVKYLGDLAICIPVVKKEAREQNKTFIAHLAHLVIHGTLHCLGYTHDKKTTTHLMETTEIEIMQHLGFSNPYEE